MNNMKEHLPLVTLGIPIYNAAELVEKTLLSALDQTYPNMEYLLIDDKGDSMDIVRRVLAGRPRREVVRIIDQKKKSRYRCGSKCYFRQCFREILVYYGC